MNCHATTETSDLLGGLRPVRGRTLLARRMLRKLGDLIALWPDKEHLASLSVPEFIAMESNQPPVLLDDGESDNGGPSVELPDDAVSRMISFSRELWESRPSTGELDYKSSVRKSKRRKLEPDSPVGTDTDDSVNEIYASLAAVVDEIESISRRYNALFEWANGPLVHAMQAGEMILLDEMSLAEDAVLERLNSVLEPSRTLVLAEKGTSEEEDGGSRQIKAHESFQLFATMNPGGDFGKRELSPALRSRFTEIWVPPVTDHFDVDLVLERALSVADLDATRHLVKQGMMEYVAWFNGPVCSDPSRPCSELSLSLRDVLSWARFIVIALQTNNEVGVWSAYRHGASLMHLDGLGLGTGLSVDDALSIKALAESFLVDRMPSPGAELSSEGSQSSQFRVENDAKFGADPFWINTGPHLGPEVSFNLGAPTTSKNVIRVLRAMQLVKPVLLEGSPGVGKTSLVGALAAASGHRLVRINLSEQTDIADLIGSDLPVPENDSQGISRAAFRWCDGVLLSAIKAGDWVLLDELNLASQSVLEGLNSCLDHRASVYIPELGQSFTCPPTFRVFAAQNPLGQGGGRKGLPKSFLNRFTKVYVDALTGDDLRTIVGTQFPSVAKSLVDKLVDFNSQIHRDAVETCLFGQAGSPWEFNLRDIFRWCELFVPTQGASESLEASHFARDLYFQRFRTVTDRSEVRARYLATFGADLATAEAPELTVSDELVRIGDVVLLRRPVEGSSRQEVSGVEPAVSLSLLEPMVAVARCISMNWPCLLIGPSGAGKESLVSSLAELCNTKLVRVALSPSSDVSELVGSFEQVGTWDEHDMIVNSLRRLAVECVQHGFTSRSEAMEELALGLDDSSNTMSYTSRKDRIDAAFELASLLSLAAPGFQTLHGNTIASALESIERIRYSSEGSDKGGNGLFEWKDGVLVEAMTHGHWLYLQNANLCPSSVLDRLNPVMEPGGSLLLAECGSSDDEGAGATHRQVRCHPNFRIFLSVNPEYGEVSRAMRNRCVEISLLGVYNGERARVVVDGLDTSWRSGLRSSLLASTFLDAHNSAQLVDANNSFKQTKPGDIQALGRVVSSLQARGLLPELSLSQCFRIVLNLDLEGSSRLSNEVANVLGTQPSAPLAPRPSIKSDWADFADGARFDGDARLVRLFTGSRGALPSSQVVFPYELRNFEQGVLKPDLDEKYAALCESLPDDALSLARVRDHALSIFLAKGNKHDLKQRISFLRSLDDSCAKSLRFMGNMRQQVLQNSTPPISGETSTGVWSEEAMQSIGFHRLPQLLHEHVWLDRTQRLTGQRAIGHGLSVLAVSFFVADGRVDRSSIACPLTPTFYPFFRAFDQWVLNMVETGSVSPSDVGTNRFSLLGLLLSRRDELWNLLQSSRFRTTGTDFLGFQEIEFIVQWTWFRKALQQMTESSKSFGSSEGFMENKRRLDLLVGGVDSVIFDSVAGGTHFGSSVLKRSARPLVPRKSAQWEALVELRSLVESFSIDAHVRGSQTEHTGPIELHDLVHLRHPILFVGSEVKREILAALCTVHLTSTEEVPGEVPAVLPASGLTVQDVFRNQIEKSMRDFSTQLDSVKIDTKIETVENLMGVDELERIMAASSVVEVTYTRLMGRLLNEFANLQLCPIVEFWCEHEEARLIREARRILLEPRHADAELSLFDGLRGSLRRFVDIAVTRTSWQVTDLRPYQTVLWMIEGAVADDVIIKRFLRCFLPVMSYNAARRTWSGSIERFYSISKSLELPALLNADPDERDQAPQTTKGMEPLTRAALHTPSSTVFSLVGGRFMNEEGTKRQTSVTTIENFPARTIQSSALVEILSTLELETKCAACFEVSFLLVEILEALRRSFPVAIHDELVLLATRSEYHRSIDAPRLRTLLLACSNPLFQEFVDAVVMPLFSCLVRLWNSVDSSPESSKDYALSMVYLGLLRFHLLLPDTPLDPGRKPIAKVRLIERRLSDLRSQLAANRIDSGMATGNFSPDTETTRELLDDGQCLLDKKQRQGNKVIERPENSPAFVHLFRELNDFARRFVGLSSVLSLTDALTHAGSSMEAIGQRELNWQMTTEAFCDRLTSSFAFYEDITLPLVDAIASMKVGVRSLLVHCNSSVEKDSKQASILNLCLHFPFSESLVGSSTVESTLDSIDLRSNNELIYQRDLAFALLSRLVIEKRTVGVDGDVLASWVTTVDRLLEASESPDEEEKPLAPIEDEQEREFREQFPDHRKDFQALLRRDDDDESVETVAADIPDDTEDNLSTLIMQPLSEHQKEMLCTLHRELFASEGHSIRDSDRIRAFRMSYGAGCRAYESLPCSSATFTRGAASAHTMAVALETPLESSPSVVSPTKSPIAEVQFDFHRDSNPVEVMKAAVPLAKLMARITQLLTAFPGNDVLIAIGRVADRVRKFDILTVSVGKVMTGLEVILRHAQDWEQHASDRVGLGEALLQVSRVVAGWRKLELHSWPTLLASREERYAKRGIQHWGRLYQLLRRALSSPEESNPISLKESDGSLDHLSPGWVWKGIKLQAERLQSPLAATSEGLAEFVKVVDTFVLTSPLGEFKTRMNVIAAFASQLRMECASNGSNNGRLHLARALGSLWRYYNEFSSFLSSKLDGLRQPFQTRLKDETKLAKWDEQSYYALAESSERSHRKLMRILKEYDEVLALSVSTILEKELCLGVRPDAESQDQPSTLVPGDSALFPLGKRSDDNIKKTVKIERTPLKNDWTDPSTAGFSVDTYTARISQYAGKVKAFVMSAPDAAPSWAFLGSLEASELCATVFERVESLRSEKTSRPMKERALVDLFRELKEQGYTSTKWSIPADLRRMADVFQVPCPIPSGAQAQRFEVAALESSEKFYQRSLAELNRLRSEVGLLGSRYLTQRQMNMMVAFGEHGLLLLAQQRSAISSILAQRAILLELLGYMSFSDHLLPLSQAYLREKVQCFKIDFALALESLRQLSLLLRSSQHLMASGEKAEWARETVTKIDSYLSMATAAYSQTKILIVTKKCIHTVLENQKALENADAMLRRAQNQCCDLGCLPDTAFETCRSKIVSAITAASLCMDPPSLGEETNGDVEAHLESFAQCCSVSVQSTLLAVQAIRKDKSDEKVDEDKSSSIWDSHRASATEWASVDLRRVKSKLLDVLTALVSIHESDLCSQETRSCCVGVTSDLCTLVSSALDVIDLRLIDTVSFYRSTTKLQYVLLRIFRVLVSKGFCSDKASEDEEGGEGDASGMTFEDDQDGTGMGEGDGKRDVTDQIENEEQLLGLKDDKEEEQEADKEQSKQLDEEEAEKGMEMEGEFDGEMYDMPDKPPDPPPQGEDDEEEELDREMGDDGGPNEEVIDEKMWDESDDEDDTGKGEEKLEKNSSVEGAAAADEMMTKNDEDEEKGQDEAGKDDTQNPDANEEEPQQEDGGDNGDTPDETINEDAEDNYEESHGIDVRNDQAQEEEEENQMELDENLELDEASDKDGDDMGGDDGVEDEGADEGDAPAPEEPLAEGEENTADPEAGNEDLEDEEPGATEARMDPDVPGEEAPEDDQPEDTALEPLKESEPSEAQKGLGVRARDGKDSVEDAMDEEEGEGGAEEEEADDGIGEGASDMEPSGQGGSSSGKQDGQNLTEGTEVGTQRHNSKEIPNPLSNPGDASKFWHRKLNVVNSQSEADENVDANDEETSEDNKQNDGDFEFAGDQEKNTTQTLAGVDENEATQLEQQEQQEQAAEASKDADAKEDNKTQETLEQPAKRRLPKPTSTSNVDDLDDDSANDMDIESEDEKDEEIDNTQDDQADSEHSGAEGDETGPTGNQVVTDLSQLHVNDESDEPIVQRRIIEEEQTTGISSAEASEARARWSRIQGETHSLSRRLCEKLRLVMEPLVASKLRGDYRTGKRINMKRVIGYIASGYRKDKIWLRRTKPAKRNYRVLVAVDDSESMLKSGAGDMALKAMATLAVGMSQLEIGEIGVASFGNEMHLLHPFTQPWTSESGPNVVRNFKFDQQRTRTALCVESALLALDTPGDQASMQLMFMISDGRIERDSRSALRRLIREMAERNILLAMIIVEGGDSKKNSIINMKEVTFENGKPKVKRFIEAYPFPYYIVLDDMRTLPEVLGDALRQWFEMLTRLQGNNS